MKKSQADWMNRHIPEEMNREEKENKTVCFHSTDIECMIILYIYTNDIILPGMMSLFWTPQKLLISAVAPKK